MEAELVLVYIEHSLYYLHDYYLTVFIILYDLFSTTPDNPIAFMTCVITPFEELLAATKKPCADER
jgi:hypothetical protein